MVFENRSPHLANLVWLSVVSFSLQVQFLLDTYLSEDVVTAPDPHLESQAVHQMNQIVEPDIRVSSPTAHALERFLYAHRIILLRHARQRIL